MTPRQTAASALLDVERDGSYSNLVLEPYFQREALSPRDRAFCAALFYGVLERRITLDWTLDHYSRTPVARLEPEERQIILLHAISGLKHREIAQLLERPLSTVLSKYHRGLKKMKALMKGESDQ